MSHDACTIKWIQPDEREDGRDDPAWYTFSGTGSDLVCFVEMDDGRYIKVYADGEMDIRVYSREGERYEEAGRIRYCENLPEFGLNADSDLISLGQLDPVERDLVGPNKAGYYFDFIHNSWFDLYDGETDEHLDAVCHSLTEAIGAAATMLTEG